MEKILYILVRNKFFEFFGLRFSSRSSYTTHDHYDGLMIILPNNTKGIVKIEGIIYLSQQQHFV